MLRTADAWLFGRRVDLAVFLGPALLAFAALAIGRAAGALDGETPDWAWVPGVLLVDVAHVWSTGFRVYFDGDELRRRPRLYAAIPIASWLAGVLLYASGGASLFWRALAYVAVFHFVRQQYGWVMLYRAKARERDRLGRAIDGAAIYAATLYPLLYWHAHLPRAFHWFVAGDFIALPSRIDDLARPLYVAILALYVARAIVSAARGAAVNVGKHLIVATTAACWWIGVVTFDSDYAFTVTNVLIHGIPYIALVAVYRRQAMKKRTPLATLVATIWVLALFEELLWDRAIWHDRPYFFGDSWTLGEGARALLVPLLAVPQSTHYVLDGFLWKRAGDPRLRAWTEEGRAAALAPES